MADEDITPSQEQSGAGDEEHAERAVAETDQPAAAAQAQADADSTAAPPAPDVTAGEVEGDAAPLDEEEGELLALLEAQLGDAIIDQADMFGSLLVRVRPDAWRRAAEVAKRDLACDYLSYIAGVDWQPAPREGDNVGGDSSAPVQPTEMTYGLTGSAGRFQLVAHVQSSAKHWGVTFKTDVDDASPRADSWVSVYPGADWHERECWEMFGVVFDGHPNLRHLYLPSEFEGHPLRKDFPLLARSVKPWPGLVDVEPMPEEEKEEEKKEVAATAEGGEGE